MNQDTAEWELYPLAERVGQVLAARGHRLAVAESCTGGWICQSITDVAGSSVWFDRGWVTYSNASKTELLGVPATILERHGAVSEETVLAMVKGVLRVCHVDCALAVSGIAGPGGAIPGKPVGTVWFAWCRRGGACVTRCERFTGDRRAVRHQAVAVALQGMLAAYGET